MCNHGPPLENLDYHSTLVDTNACLVQIVFISALLVSKGHGHATLNMASYIGCLEAVKHLFEVKHIEHEPIREQHNNNNIIIYDISY